MNITYKIRAIAASMLLGMSIASCNDWLDVNMTDKVMENTLFNEYQGFRTALNGVYTGMNDIYAGDLGPGGLDVMAQYYNVTENNSHSKRMFSGYKYTDSGFQSTTNNIWSQLYSLLANTNVIIEHTDIDRDVLTSSQYGIIRGEALALRAFLHFDLLRLYGPIYSQNPDEICIPYQGSSSRDIQPLLPASEVLGYIIRDLKDAEALLAQYDPVITEGVGNVQTEDNGVSSYDNSFRQLRLNYYAVEALLARAYLWKGDKTEAYKYAKNNIIDKITTENLEVFPWITRQQVEAAEKPDLLFSSEVIFSLYNSKRVDNVQRNLFASSLGQASRLTFIGTSLNENSKVATFYDDPNDFRLKMWEVVEPSEAEKQEAAENNTEATNSLALTKYNDFTSNDAASSGVNTYRYMIPLIRLSEMYLIAAESTSDTNEALSLINTIRLHRDCVDAPDNADIDKLLTYEMAREVIGEGQLFYFYKRRAMTELISGTSTDGTFNMILSNYIFPIPDAELEKRVLVNGQ